MYLIIIFYFLYFIIIIIYCTVLYVCMFCKVKLCTSSSVDGGGREGLPDDRLADIGGDEERDARSKAIALL